MQYTRYCNGVANKPLCTSDRCSSHVTLAARDRESEQMRARKICAAIAGIVTLGLLASPAMAQKSGGALKIFFPGKPARQSDLQKGKLSTRAPPKAPFNKLILFHHKQNQKPPAI